MKYLYVLFDLDGTLSNTKEGIVKCVDYALQTFSISTENLDDLVKFIGPPLRESFQKFYQMSPQDTEKAVEQYRERYHSKGVWENTLFDGVTELLQSLKQAGAVLAVATSKPTEFAKMALEQHNIEKYFDVVVGSEFDGTRELKTEVIAEVLRQLNLDKAQRSQIVMIGDRYHDILGGKQFSLATIGIRLGFAQPGELESCQPDYIVEDYAELKKLLLD